MGIYNNIVANSSFDFEYKITECRLSLVRCRKYLAKIDSNERQLVKRRLTLVENYEYTMSQVAILDRKFILLRVRCMYNHHAM